MDPLAKKLLDLKKKAEQSSQEAAEYRGQLSQLKASLKEEFGCKDEHEAQVKLEALNQELHSLNQQIEQGLQKIETDYEF